MPLNPKRALTVVVLSVTSRRRISATNRWLIALIVVCCGLWLVPYEEWKLLMVRVHGAQHVRKTWIVSATAASEVHLLDYLLTHGVDVNTRAQYGESPLGAAAAAGQMEAARHLIARGARLDNRPLITLETPLIEAARMNHMDMVQLLMAYGADPSARDVWQHPTNVAIDRVSIEGLPDDSPNSFGIVEGFGVGFNVVNGIVYTGELPRSSTLGIYTS